ncbi:helix-turn-helix domain-containing protein [Selenihalanaerobacter shriftii]|uniref:DNA binding domain-containing protein, excisionase family n=1 Tax=Selenihalanaerobacter shriftii TaxID=142842 RepID=A0A1T4KD75_9FIRM|nr:helix-turn-helix domain-containing protein [Selenihalanaerobacter shriftii]SJZ40295.1 DNA binding domain-containing protein, excisionase family [Selenihalanaerobacter shriftii]
MSYGVGLDYLTVEKVAELLVVKSEVIEGYLYAGELPGIKTGEEWRIEVEDLKEFITGLMADQEKEKEFKQHQPQEVAIDWTLDECGNCGELGIINKESHPFCSSDCQEVADLGFQAL